MSLVSFARSVLLLGLVTLALVSGCSCGSSHSRDDAGPSTSDAPLSRADVGTTGSDAGVGVCPSGIDPWNPENPANACSPEGSRCSSGGGSACGFYMGCECEAGRWSCVVAEPDPACWCGREPSPGSPCNEEGASCGACCPSAEDPDPFGPFTCVAGQWTESDCPAIECPPIDPPRCPAVRELGTSCANEGQTCGDPCCSAQTCVGGVWIPGPEADCLCDPTSTFSCGGGSCGRGTACASTCGPDDGLEHFCEPLPAGCTSCACIDLEPGQICEDRDGHVFLSQNVLCG